MHKLERLCETMLLYNYIMSACHREIYIREIKEKCDYRRMKNRYALSIINVI